MTVTAETCPSCGAPLSVVAGRCSYCQVPLEITTPAGAAAGTPATTRPPEDPNAPFAMTVADVFFIKGRGTIATGQIASGTVHVGDALVLDGPKGSRATECAGVEMFRKQLDHAQAGDNVGLLLKGLEKDDVASGDQLHTS
ncbi:MAG TPA: EF-Tu/IF-2/RF-3 family GTPase [Acidimicrobiales bacterium]